MIIQFYFEKVFLINLLNFEILRKLLCLEMKTLNGKIHATNNYRGKILFNHQNEGKEKAIEGEREREGEIEIPRGGIDPVIIIYHSIFRRYKWQSRIGINAVQYSCFKATVRNFGFAVSIHAREFVCMCVCAH